MSDLELVRRWQAVGAGWRVMARAPGRLTLALCRCDGGEEVQRLSSSEPELLAMIGNRNSSEDEADG